MSRTSFALGAVFCLLLAPLAPGQTAGTAPGVQMPRQGTPLPPRDTSARRDTTTQPAGTATITGRVIAADSGQPLRRALVTAVPVRGSEAIPRGGAFQMRRSLSARTDDDGRYVIAQVPAGEYTLVARRSGYVEQAFGQVTTRAPGRRVAVAEGASIGPLDFPMQRGGVITGRVVDDGGEPAERVSVRAVLRRRVFGQNRLQITAYADNTDDLGHYRLFGLPPGEYVVVAEPGGERRGPFMGGRGIQGVEVDTIPTYGPGTVNPAEALDVRVEPGLESAMDVQLVAARVATVRGKVLSAGGDPIAFGMVRLQLEGGESVGMGRGTPITGGQFQIDGVAPGTYTVAVETMIRGGSNGPDSRGEAATQTIAVEGEDVVVTLTTSPGSVVRGRIAVEGDASGLAGRELRLAANSSGGAGPGQAFPARGRVASDQSFEIAGLHGEQGFTVQGLPEGWWVKDIRIEGQSALSGFDFGHGRTFTGVEIVLSSRPTGLSGRVALPTGATAADYAVILFSEEEDEWERALPGQGPGARLVRPGLDGAFTLQPVRPGSYYVLALPAEQADVQALTDPDQLRELAGRARTIDVKEGQISPVTLTLVNR